MKQCDNCKKNLVEESERDVCKECIDKVIANNKE